MKHPSKTAAHTAVNTAIRKGSLVKENCFNCGNPETEAHHDDYSKPLKVTWLCGPCHYKRHAQFIQPPAAIRQRSTSPQRRLGIKIQAPNGTRRPDCRAITEPNRFSALSLRKKGMTYAQIGEKLNISRSQAFKWANRPAYD